MLARTGAEVEASASAVRYAGGEALPSSPTCSTVQAFEKPWRNLSSGAEASTFWSAAGSLKAIGPLAHVDADAWWSDLETSVGGAYDGLPRGTSAFDVSRTQPRFRSWSVMA